MGHPWASGADEARPHNQGDKDKTTKTREHKITTLYFRLTLHSHGIRVPAARRANASGRGPWLRQPLSPSHPLGDSNAPEST